MAQSTSYDELPYSSKAFPYTHPDRLAVWATLLGLTPRPADGCRVLELGCGLGANLMPLAQALPHSRFLGIDLSTRQIDAGKQVAADLGLTNIDLQALNILEFDAGLGEFDYILCHGVYSWVPEPVRDKILSICKDHLAPQGVAYVSYNTFPGWHIKGMIREMMAYHVQGFTEPRAKVEQARALVELLAEAVGDTESIYGRLLDLEASDLRRVEDTYIFHEHLEDVNRPYYFHQFAAQARSKGLQYLAEAMPLVLTRNLSPAVARKLSELSGDVIQGEQYLDFVRNQTFRRTLLVHEQAPIQRPPAADRLVSMSVAGLSWPTRDASGDLDAKAEFRSQSGHRISTNNPFLKTALTLLHEIWPGTLPFAALVERVQDHLQGQSGGASLPLSEAPRLLADALLQCYLMQFVNLHVQPPALTGRISARPLATPLARYQAERRLPVINLNHTTVYLGEAELCLLRRLDGQRDQASLRDELTAAAARGQLGPEAAAQAGNAAAMTAALAGILDRLAKAALLQA